MSLGQYLENCCDSDREAILLLRGSSVTMPICVHGMVEAYKPEVGLLWVNGQAIEQTDIIGFPEPGF